MQDEKILVLASAHGVQSEVSVPYSTFSRPVCVAPGGSSFTSVKRCHGT